MNEQETFLNVRAPGFKAAENALKSQGWKEKRFSRSTSAQIEKAFTIYLMKQMAAAAGRALTPQESEQMRQMAISRLPELYSTGANGAQILQYKMYTRPRPVNRAAMDENVEFEEEEFISNAEQQIMAKLNSNLDKVDKEVERAQKAAANAEKNASAPTARARPNVGSVYVQVARNIRGLADASKQEARMAKQMYSSSRFNQAQYHLDRARQAAKMAIDIKKEDRPVGMLANMMARTNFGTQYQLTPQGWVHRPEYKNYSPELVEQLARMGISNRKTTKGGRKTHKRKMRGRKTHGRKTYRN